MAVHIRTIQFHDAYRITRLDVIDKALAKMTMENHARDTWRTGSLLRKVYLRDVYEKYGVL